MPKGRDPKNLVPFLGGVGCAHVLSCVRTVSGPFCPVGGRFWLNPVLLQDDFSGVGVVGAVLQVERGFSRVLLMVSFMKPSGTVCSLFSRLAGSSSPASRLFSMLWRWRRAVSLGSLTGGVRGALP